MGEDGDVRGGGAVHDACVPSPDGYHVLVVVFRGVCAGTQLHSNRDEHEIVRLSGVCMCALDCEFSS